MDGGTGSKSAGCVSGVGVPLDGSVLPIDFGEDGKGGASFAGSGLKSARPSAESSTVKVMSSSKSCHNSALA